VKKRYRMLDSSAGCDAKKGRLAPFLVAALSRAQYLLRGRGTPAGALRSPDRGDVTGITDDGMRRTERGAALILAMFVASVLALLASSLLTSVGRATDAVRLAHYDTQARLLAEAGIEKAIGELSQGRLDYQGETATRLSGGEFSLSVKPMAEQPEERQVCSTGVFPHRSRHPRRCTLVVQLRQVKSGWSVVRWIDEKR